MRLSYFFQAFPELGNIREKYAMIEDGIHGGMGVRLNIVTQYSDIIQAINSCPHKTLIIIINSSLMHINA